MAKTSQIVKNQKRQKLVKRYAKRRAALKEQARRAETPLERFAAQAALAALPKNANPCRVTTRCPLTGRPRGTLRRFNMSRISFRELALQGAIPGVIKSSW
jgi:small subunit ribosomal protein S14